MSEHASPVLDPHSETHAEANGEREHEHGPRFEKSELQYFVEDDQDAGSNIGKLLALTFLILVVLMTAVAIWTSRNQFTSQDPFES
jgi:hypothetical protein